MKSFNYTITDPVGLHARPAGMLVKEVKNYDSKVTITRKEDGKSADASRLMAVMSLAVKCGQTVEVAVDGGNEEASLEGMKAFFEANL